MVRTNASIANASIFLEGGYLKANETHPSFARHPALMFGTQFAPRHGKILPAACDLAYQPDELYSFWSCPRVKMNATGYGHCDIIDDLGWEACHISNFCFTTTENDRDTYRLFLQGIISAFLITYVQGYPNATQYFTNPSYFLGVNVTHFAYDVAC